MRLRWVQRWWTCLWRWAHPWVNFINVLRDNFTYESLFRSFFLVTFWQNKHFCMENALVKRWWEVRNVRNDTVNRTVWCLKKYIGSSINDVTPTTTSSDLYCHYKINYFWTTPFDYLAHPCSKRIQLISIKPW